MASNTDPYGYQVTQRHDRLLTFKQFPRFCFIKFVHPANDNVSEGWCDILVQKGNNFETMQQRLLNLNTEATQLKVDEKSNLIMAEQTSNPRKNSKEWQNDVKGQIKKCGLEVTYYAIVHIGLKAKEIKQEIEKDIDDIHCELSHKHLTLLLYSNRQEQVEKARQKAKNAEPCNDLPNELTTNFGLEVAFSDKDISKVPTDCVVCEVDDKLSRKTVLSVAIERAAGRQLAVECSKKKTLKVDEVHVMPCEPLWRNLFLAHGPSSRDTMESHITERLTNTVYNCLLKAEDSDMTSLAMPLISFEGNAKLSPEVCSESYRAAIEQFSKTVQTAQHLKKVIFLDNNPDRIEKVKTYLGKELTRGDTLRLVLIGSTGMGKSSTGNSILGQKAFDAQLNFNVGTTQTSYKCGYSETYGVHLEVVDSPGLGDLEQSSLIKRTREIAKTLVCSLPGPHVFLFVLRGVGRFTTHEREACKKLEELFQGSSDKDRFYEFVIIVFTHVKCETELKESLKSSAPAYLTELIKRCGNRVVGIDNCDPHGKESVNINQLIKKALELRDRNGGQSAIYTNDTMQRCLQLLRSDQYSHKSLQSIKWETQYGKVPSFALDTFDQIKKCSVM